MLAAVILKRKSTRLLPAIYMSWRVEKKVGAVVALFTGGAYFGAMLASPVTGRFGRRWAIVTGTDISTWRRASDWSTEDQLSHGWSVSRWPGCWIPDYDNSSIDAPLTMAIGLVHLVPELNVAPQPFVHSLNLLCRGNFSIPANLGAKSQ
jgi:hypothetical protein